MVKRKLKHFIIFVGVLFFCFSSYAQDAKELKRPGKLFPPSKISLLEDPERDKWQKPYKIIAVLGIKKGHTVADIGAGSGYFTLKLLKVVGQKGFVYAVDVQQEMLEYIKERLNAEESKNTRLVLGDMNDPHLPVKSIDTAVLISTYHEIAQPVEFMKNLKPALKSSGKVAILEFSKESPVGPPANVRLPEELVINEMKEAGFTLVERHTFILPYQYFLVFSP